MRKPQLLAGIVLALGLLALPASAQFGGSLWSVVGFTTLNPSDLLRVTLSGGNLTATQTNAAGDGGVRSIAGYSSGKYYFEFLCNVLAGSDTGVGIAEGGAGFVNLAGSATGGVIFYSGGGSGSIYVNGSSATTGTACVAGDFVHVAVDYTAELIWFKNTNPVGSMWWNYVEAADPDTAVGGISFSALTGPYFAAVVVATSSVDSYTVNFGASAFNNGTPPATFTGRM